MERVWILGCNESIIRSSWTQHPVGAVDVIRLTSQAEIDQWLGSLPVAAR